MTITIKEIHEWSIMNNKTIKIHNKPKELRKGTSGFEMTYEALRW